MKPKGAVIKYFLYTFVFAIIAFLLGLTKFSYSVFKYLELFFSNIRSSSLVVLLEGLVLITLWLLNVVFSFKHFKKARIGLYPNTIISLLSTLVGNIVIALGISFSLLISHSYVFGFFGFEIISNSSVYSIAILSSLLYQLLDQSIKLFFSQDSNFDKLHALLHNIIRKYADKSIRSLLTDIVSHKTLSIAASDESLMSTVRSFYDELLDAIESLEQELLGKSYILTHTKKHSVLEDSVKKLKSFVSSCEGPRKQLLYKKILQFLSGDNSNSSVKEAVMSFEIVKKYYYWGVVNGIR